MLCYACHMSIRAKHQIDSNDTGFLTNYACFQVWVAGLGEELFYIIPASKNVNHHEISRYLTYEYFLFYSQCECKAKRWDAWEGEAIV